MSLHELHLRYLARLPHESPSNNLVVLFHRLEKFEPMERMELLDFTCAAFGVNAPGGIRCTAATCDSTYREFRERIYEIANGNICDFMLAYLVVLFTLAVLHDRADPERSAQVIRSMRRTIEMNWSQAEDGEIGRETANLIISDRERAIERQANGRKLAQDRYERFCSEVVGYLL